MEVLLVSPFGYCSGVYEALSLAKKAKRENPQADVYLVGCPVHNELAISGLEKEGLKLLDERKEDLGKAILSLPEGSVLVFSAHGHPRLWEEEAAKRGLCFYDATCPFVKQNEAIGKETSPLIYIGSPAHAEAIAFLANCPHAYFYDASTGEGDWRNCPAHPRLVSQTTLSEGEIELAEREIKEKYPDAALLKGRCQATRQRQSSIRKAAQNADAAIILGSKTSNNSRKLQEIASQFCPSFLCLDLQEVKALPLEEYKKIALASGASTPREVYFQVRDYLSSLPSSPRMLFKAR